MGFNRATPSSRSNLQTRRNSLLSGRELTAPLHGWPFPRPPRARASKGPLPASARVFSALTSVSLLGLLGPLPFVEIPDTITQGEGRHARFHPGHMIAFSVHKPLNTILNFILAYHFTIIINFKSWTYISHHHHLIHFITWEPLIALLSLHNIIFITDIS